MEHRRGGVLRRASIDLRPLSGAGARSHPWRRVLPLILAVAIAVPVLPSRASAPVLASANYALGALSDSPAGYWRLGDAIGATTAADASGHAFALTYASSGVTLGQPGAINTDTDTSALFNGTTGEATKAGTPTAATSNWTVEAWVNPSNLNQAGTIVYNGVAGSNGYGFAISSATSLTTAGSELTGIVNGAIADSGYGFASPNTWYHVVMSRDTSTIRFYVNGGQTSKTNSSAPSAPAGRFSIGSAINSSGGVVRPFAGGIDEAAVYASQLTLGRIAAHYQEGAVAIASYGQWSQLAPATIPSGRFDPAVAYDAAHSQVVLFGGQNSSGAAIQETWTWNGTNWTKLSPATQPSGRWGARMAYDTATGNVVLFGGQSGTSTYLNDTWTWSGTTWAQLAPATSPSTRADAAMAYDAATSTILMHGGKNSSYSAETWSWNGTTWAKLSPSSAPGARAGSAMAYDAGRGQVVLFGGYTGSSYLAETWTWNGTTWSKPTPASSPSARTATSLAYDPITATTMLFGGVNGSSYYADTWSWDGITWGQQNSSTNPGARSAPGYVWDGATSNILLYGGRNSAGPLSDSWNRNTPPDVATAVSGTAGNQQVTVRWTAPATGGSQITKYVVTASPGGASATVTGNPPAATAIATGLTNGTAYTFKVQTSNAIGAGTLSAASAAVTPYTVPGAPTGVSATARNGQATVTWTAPAFNGGSTITSYTITSSPGAFTGTVSGNPPATSGTVTGLANGTAYTFTVYATNAAGNGASSNASNSVTPSTTPGAPTNVVATAGDGQAGVSWTAPANGGSTITSYKVTSSPGGLTATVTGNPAGTAATVTGLTNLTSYTFTVVATNANGPGSASAASNAVTPSVLPGAPTGVTARASNLQATVTWTAPAPNGGSAISGYTVTPYIGSTAGSPTQVGASTTSATISGLSNGTTYTFQVTATNTGGTGPAGTSNTATPAATPQAPGNVVATAGNTQATVTWTAPDPGATSITGYTITPYIGANAGTSVPAGPSATGVTVTGLVNGTTYTFQIYATNSYGNGFVATSNAATPATVPTVPTGISAVNGNGQATVSWSAPASNGGAPITSYTVTPYVGGTAGSPSSVGGTVFSLVVTGLTNGTNYTFQVYASNSAGAGGAGYSNALLLGSPGAPGDLAATPGTNQLGLSWMAASPNASPITAYQVTAYLSGVPASSVTVGPSAARAVLSGLAGGAAYTINVTALNIYGASPPASASGTPTGSVSTYATIVATDGAASYVRMADLSGAFAADSVTGNLATLSSGVTTGIAGPLFTDPAPALSFPSGGYAQTSYVQTAAVAYSVEAWVNTTGSAQGQNIVRDRGVSSGTSGKSLTLGLNNSVCGGIAGAPFFALDSDNLFIGVQSQTAINDGNWHHVVGVFSGSSGGAVTPSQFTIYVDGRAAALSTCSVGSASAPLTGLDGTRIGGDTWIGQIGQVAIYNTALTSSQVSNHLTAAGALPPGAPSGVSAAAGTNQATVTWTPPAGPGVVTAYVVSATTGGAQANSVATTGASTSATITGLAGGATYTFRVVALNPYGTGPASAASNAVSPTGMSGTYAATVLADAPSAYFRLGDSAGSSIAADSSGASDTATVSAGVTLGGGSALPNDADTSASISGGTLQGPQANLPFNNASRTLEAWFKTNSGAQQGIMGYGVRACCYPPTSFNVLLRDATRVDVNYDGLNSSHIFTANYSLADGRWHMIDVGFDGNVLTVYIDGQSIGSQTTGAVTTSGDSYGLTMGAIRADSVQTFNGSVDEMAVYPAALSASKILTHFNASGNSRPAVPQAVSATAGTNSATVVWTTVQNVAPVSAYVVTAVAAGTSPQNAVATGPNATSVTLTGLAGGKSYTVQVYGINAYGRGAPGSSGSITPSGPSNPYPATILGDAPSAYYRLSETSGTMLAESSGQGLPGSYVGSYTLGAAGALSGDSDPAVSLSGAGYAQVLAPPLPIGNAARTVEAWINTTSTSRSMIVGYGAADCCYPPNAFNVLLQSSNQIDVEFNGAGCCGGANSITTPTTLTDGKWHLIDVTFDGNVLTVFVDGQLTGSKAVGAITTYVDGNGLLIGAVSPGFSPEFNGSIDEVAIYPAALTASQIGGHYSAAGAGFPNAPTNVVATALTNAATVSWTAPAPHGGAVTQYTVTPVMQGGPAQPPVIVSASSTSTNVPNLAAGSAETFQVTATNQYGTGPAGTSNAVTPSAGNANRSLDRYLYIRTSGAPARGIYYEGWTGNAPVPAANLQTGLWKAGCGGSRPSL